MSARLSSSLFSMPENSESSVSVYSIDLSQLLTLSIISTLLHVESIIDSFIDLRSCSFSANSLFLSSFAKESFSLTFISVFL